MTLSANEAKALSAIFGTGTLTRANLARRLGLTRSTTGLLVQSLEQAGLIREREMPEAPSNGGARLGRPGIQVEIDGGHLAFLGCYVGVNAIAMTAVDLSGSVRLELSSSLAGAGVEPDEAIAKVVELVGEVRGALGPAVRTLGLTVAVPGFVSPNGTVYHATILGWHDVDVVGIVETALGNSIPVMVENDANAVALAEAYRAPDGADAGDSLVVLIENGVGGGIVSGGRLYRGQFRGAGEIGHMPIGDEGYVFDARRPGRFESFVGMDAVLARYAHVSGERRSFAELLVALEAAHPAAERTAADWAYWLARGLAVLASVLQPGRIVLAGSVSALFPFVADQVLEAFSARLVEGFPVPPIEQSRLGANAPALGAALGLHQLALTGDDRFPIRIPGQYNPEGGDDAAQG